MPDLIRSQDDLHAMIEQFGILPYFTCDVPGWSVEEHIDPAYWFTDRDGPWEWKGRLALKKQCIYGKFIRNKAAFISPRWFPDLANWRRDGYDWEGFVQDGHAPRKDMQLMQYIHTHPMCLSRDARKLCGIDKGYDTVITRLQMQTFVILPEFRYRISKTGQPYGWGDAVLDTPEHFLGEETMEVPASRSPAESLERIVSHLHDALPFADAYAIRKELR